MGKTDPAGVKDVCLESALTTIQDCEDSVAAVDAEDKVVYRNWLGLMKGDLAETFRKGQQPDSHRIRIRQFTAPDGGGFSLPGRSLLFVRNVGHLMTNDAVLTAGGRESPRAYWTPCSPPPVRSMTCAARVPCATPEKAACTSLSPKCTDPTRSVSQWKCSPVSRRFLG